mmetsp:Transcript_2914/g.4262  ORF Transcript_2914/g.4262 Transcript_2914/m.4262 type:complete len:116 (+) Transcript_2914:185-532(+)
MTMMKPFFLLSMAGLSLRETLAFVSSRHGAFAPALRQECVDTTIAIATTTTTTTKGEQQESSRESTESSDAALALELQKEEEKLAASVANQYAKTKTAETAWEQVTPRKKKRAPV